MPYRLEYSPNNRAGCKGPKPCAGTKIKKGELRLGTLVEIQGNQSFHWKHWGCSSAKVLRNIQEKEGITDPNDLDGYEDLLPIDQARVQRAFVMGHVAAEDIPESARIKPSDIDEAGSASQTVKSPASAPAPQPTTTDIKPKKRG